jgi:hypothetical protein
LGLQDNPRQGLPAGGKSRCCLRYLTAMNTTASSIEPPEPNCIAHLLFLNGDFEF